MSGGHLVAFQKIKKTSQFKLIGQAFEKYTKFWLKFLFFVERYQVTLFHEFFELCHQEPSPPLLSLFDSFYEK